MIAIFTTSFTCYFSPNVEAAAKIGSLVSWTKDGVTYYRGYQVGGIVSAEIKTVSTNTDNSKNKYSTYWQYWSQGASAMGNLARSYGCRMVAQAKLLVESGVIKGSTFNPDVYINWMINNGYLNKNTFLEQFKTDTGEGMIKAAKSVYGVTITRGEKISLTGDFSASGSSTDRTKIMQKLKEGYYIILSCNAHQAYVGREVSIALGEPVVLDSGSDRSTAPSHAHTLRRASTTAYTYAYCYKVGPHPTPTVTFNANGGTTPVATKVVTSSEPLGTLPVPTYTGHVFAGWFTTSNNYVNASTTVTAISNFTLNARYYPSYEIKRTSVAVSGVNAKRVADSLIVFINSQKATGTNEYGYEVFVDQSGTVTKLEEYVGNATVPLNGFIISGHGAMRLWLKENMKVGDHVAFDAANMQIIVYDTSQKGDVNGDGSLNADDAIYLLYRVFFGESNYPVDQDCDFNKSGKVDADDAIHLLYRVFFGEENYPL